MKPRNLTEENWDVNVAVFESPALDARVTADGKRFWFRVSTATCCADVTMPVNDFRMAVDYVQAFDVTTLTDERPSAGCRVGSHGVEILSRVGIKKNGKWVLRKFANRVHISPLRENRDSSITIRLSVFKKLIRWYNSDL